MNPLKRFILFTGHSAGSRDLKGNHGAFAFKASFDSFSECMQWAQSQKTNFSWCHVLDTKKNFIKHIDLQQV